MNINNYKVFQLDQKAIEFIRNRLQNILHTPLSELLNSKLDLNKGYAFTILPDYVKEEKYKLENFNEGGLVHLDNSKVISTNELIAVEVPNTTDALAEYFINYLQKNEHNIIIVENILAKPEDDYVKNSKFSTKFFGESVYYMLKSKDNRQTLIEVIKECSSSPEAIGVLSFIDEKEQDLTPEAFFEEVIINMNALFVEAYDHESYIIWEKQSGI